jgi:hypothetical protein
MLPSLHSTGRLHQPPTVRTLFDRACRCRRDRGTGDRTSAARLRASTTFEIAEARDAQPRVVAESSSMVRPPGCLELSQAPRASRPRSSPASRRARRSATPSCVAPPCSLRTPAPSHAARDRPDTAPPDQSTDDRSAALRRIDVLVVLRRNRTRRQRRADDERANKKRC